MEKLKARTDLSVSATRHDGQTLIVIQDPIGIIQEPLILSEVGAVILSLLDGERTLEDVNRDFRNLAAGEIPIDFVARLVGEIETLGLLEDEIYAQRKKEIIDGFVSAPLRVPSHASGAYESDPGKLAAWIDEIVGKSPVGGSSISGDLQVLVAPHIDFRVNTDIYARAYSQLHNRNFDRVVLMGTGHSILEGLYCPTHKDFETPFGVTRCDKRAIERLLCFDNGVVAPNDFPHRFEHSLEFQLIFLQRLLGAENFELVPILCGTVGQSFDSAARLGEIDSVGPFLDALREIIGEEGRRTLVVAGVDFSHVGLRFSHPVAASEMMEETRRHDRDLIDAFLEGDAEGFWRIEAETKGFFNVCGFLTLSTILETVGEKTGRCLAYDVWDDAPTGSAVTFAALAVS